MKSSPTERDFFITQHSNLSKMFGFCRDIFSAKRQSYFAVAQKLGISPKTAENHIKRFTLQGLLIHYAHDKYKNA
jgi:hypothetical protein